jgi:hypothetical protein
VIRSENVAALTIDEDLANAKAPDAPLLARIDGAALTFAPGATRCAYRDTSGWHAGPRPSTDGARKHDLITGPIRDIFHSPVMFVYGTQDPKLSTVNELVARTFARMKPGTHVRYPVMSDREFTARGESRSAPRALFLVGSGASNSLVSEFEDALPFRGAHASIRSNHGAEFTGPGLGVTFIYPNPKQPNQYLVNVIGTDAEGTFRSLSLPDLLPDYLVYDARMSQSRGETVLGPGRAIASGFFNHDWSVPALQVAQAK